jgi:hypothetical protein
MGACSSTTSYKPNHHSCPTPSLKLWGLGFFFYFTKKTTLQTQHNHFVSTLQNNILSMGALSLLFVL